MPEDTSEHMTVADSMGHGNHLKVVVRDDRDGTHYQVDFLANLQGEYKHDGGGGFHPARKAVFETAKEVAREYVEDTLNHDVVAKSEWTRVSVSTAKRILEQSDDYEVHTVNTESDEGSVEGSADA